jgi:hypothetical protein
VRFIGAAASERYLGSLARQCLSFEEVSHASCIRGERSVSQPFGDRSTGHITDSHSLEQRTILGTGCRRRRGEARQAHRLPQRKQGPEAGGRRKDRFSEELHRCTAGINFREPSNSARSTLIL